MRMRERQYAAADDATPRRYQPVPLDSMSEWLGNAATAGEDEAFFDHHGIDWKSLRQAIGYRREGFSWSDPRDRAELERAVRRAGERRDQLRGASTITQQLAKNLYLSPSRNPLRKVKEAVIAYRLEWALSKERILELYLNVAEFGPNLWGVEAASQAYFERSATELSMDQAAMLIATLPHPLTSNPSLRPGRTRWRQQLILRKLRGEDVEVPTEVHEADTTLRRVIDSMPPLPLPTPTPLPSDTLPLPPLPIDTSRWPTDTPGARSDTLRRGPAPAQP